MSVDDDGMEDICADCAERSDVAAVVRVVKRWGSAERDALRDLHEALDSTSDETGATLWPRDAKAQIEKLKAELAQAREEARREAIEECRNVVKLCAQGGNSKAFVLTGPMGIYASIDRGLRALATAEEKPRDRGEP